MRLFPPHQDIPPMGKKAHCRDIPDDQVGEWLARGWVKTKEESYGLRKQEDQEDQAQVEEKPKRGRKPREVNDGNGS